MHTFLTDGNTHDSPSSCLYAPTPRSTLFESLSARYAALNPNMTSGGACGTLARGCELTVAMAKLWKAVIVTGTLEIQERMIPTSFHKQWRTSHVIGLFRWSEGDQMIGILPDDGIARCIYIRRIL